MPQTVITPIPVKLTPHNILFLCCDDTSLLQPSVGVNELAIDGEMNSSKTISNNFEDMILIFDQMKYLS